MQPLHTISIEQFRRQGLQSAICYRNDLLITNQLEKLSLFKYPCRISAVTVLFCLHGEIDCSINLEPCHIGSNSVLISFSENIIQIHRADDVVAYALLVSTDYLDQLHLDIRKRSSYYIGIRQRPVVQTSYDDIASLKSYYTLLSQQIRNLHEESPNIIAGLVHAFVYHVVSLLQPNTVNDQNGDSTTNASIIFERFMHQLTLHHTQERSVKFYADRLHLTPNYFSRIVKEHSGKSVGEWIDEYVMLEAKALLKCSDMNIKEIAYMLNFTTQSAFGKYFRQQAGCGPREFRESI